VVAQLLMHRPALQVGVPVSQTLQKVPSWPQASLALPATQLLAPSQQPPLQSVWVNPPQVVEQAPVTVSHAIPDGQSVATVQGPCVRSGTVRSAGMARSPTLRSPVGTNPSPPMSMSSVVLTASGLSRVQPAASATTRKNDQRISSLPKLRLESYARSARIVQRAACARPDGDDNPRDVHGMRILLVANRQPFAGRTDASGPAQLSTGGLVSALAPVMMNGRGLWIAARTESAGGEGRMRGPVDVRLIGVPDREHAGYYQALANRALWPLFHSLIPLAHFDPPAWRDYVRVNERFADAVLEEARDGDLVWVHDYHLMLVPRLVRLQRPSLRIGFFLHIPFPPFEVFRVLPWAREILAGLLSADLIGFHTTGYAEDFVLTAQRLLHGEPTAHVRVGAFPIGIDAEDFAREAAARATDVAVRRLRAALRAHRGERVVALGVDRLDYTKGINERLLAVERFLDDHPRWRGRFVLVQVAVPSRTRVEEYRRMKEELERTVGRINGRLGEAGWMPIRYLYRSLPRRELVSYYRAADLALVTPLRDGMNLVAKEYVASRVDDTGALVLSELAGAAQELHGALRVNPYDLDGVAAAIAEAVALPPGERARRMAAMREHVARFDTRWWAQSFLERLSLSHPAEASAPALAPG
jgi:alpha,alpha-trehalose-phosphate synthase [UDP-forming]